MASAWPHWLRPTPAEMAPFLTRPDPRHSGNFVASYARALYNPPDKMRQSELSNPTDERQNRHEKGAPSTLADWNTTVYGRPSRDTIERLPVEMDTSTRQRLRGNATKRPFRRRRGGAEFNVSFVFHEELNKGLSAVVLKSVSGDSDGTVGNCLIQDFSRRYGRPDVGCRPYEAQYCVEYWFHRLFERRWIILLLHNVSDTVIVIYQRTKPSRYKSFP